jgi:hypothetical protein
MTANYAVRNSERNERIQPHAQTSAANKTMNQAI